VSVTSTVCFIFFVDGVRCLTPPSFDPNIRLPVRATRYLDLGATGFHHSRRCCRGPIGSFGGSLRGCQYSRGWSIGI
jgi:hypothetical protein